MIPNPASTFLSDQRIANNIEYLRQEFIRVHRYAVWAQSCAYGDMEKVLDDIRRGRASWHVVCAALDQSLRRDTPLPGTFRMLQQLHTLSKEEIGSLKFKFK